MSFLMSFGSYAGKNFEGTMHPKCFQRLDLFFLICGKLEKNALGLGQSTEIEGWEGQTSSQNRSEKVSKKRLKDNRMCIRFLVDFGMHICVKI